VETFKVIVTTSQIVDVQAENAEQAIEIVKSRLQPRDAACASFQVAEEVNLEETKE
jgi:hypothetical protein